MGPAVYHYCHSAGAAGLIGWLNAGSTREGQWAHAPLPKAYRDRSPGEGLTTTVWPCRSLWMIGRWLSLYKTQSGARSSQYPC
jgi:hypothetical protein